MPDDFKDSFVYTFGLYSGVGIQLSVSALGGLWLGNILDKRFGTSPWILFLGMTLGTIAGFYNLMRILKSEKERKNVRN